MTPWTLTSEDVAAPDASRLRRAYYAEVASRYWHRPATAEEVDRGLTNDGAARLTPPTGQFVVGRYEGHPASCGGILLLDADRAELTRIYVCPAHRGTGGADLLLARLETEARALGATQMVLDTRLDLIEARTVYTRHGYQEIPAYSSGPYAEICYGKPL